MPDLIRRAPDNPEFARVIELRKLRDLDAFDFDISPEPEEAAAIARLLGARSVRKLRFAGELSRLERGGWELEATLGASAVQSCVVTLDPITTRIDQTVRRLWLPDAVARAAEIVVDPEEDDEIEPLGDRIDLGRVAVEALALALPAYPRKPGVALRGVDARGRGRGRRTETVRRPRGAARESGRQVVRPRAGACAPAGNRYVPRFVFPARSGSRGRDTVRPICYGPGRRMECPGGSPAKIEVERWLSRRAKSRAPSAACAGRMTRWSPATRMIARTAASCAARTTSAATVATTTGAKSWPRSKRSISTTKPPDRRPRGVVRA